MRLDVRKSAASSKCCGWWQCDKIKDVAQGREERKDRMVRRDVTKGGMEGGCDRSFGEKNKGVATRTVSGTY